MTTVSRIFGLMIPVMQLDALEWKARNPSKDELHSAMQATRRRTIAGVQCYRTALGDSLHVPHETQLNPPRWELGHIGWFYDWWIARNPGYAKGLQADPLAKRKPARQASKGRDADSLYNSSDVHHSNRWSIALPTIDETLKDLEESLEETFECLAKLNDNPESHYFFRLSVLHEDMHAEAAVYMAQCLGISMDEGWKSLVFSTASTLMRAAPTPDTARSSPNPAIPNQLRLGHSQPWDLGFQGEGFCFDNECPKKTVQLQAFEIDSKPVSWEDYLAFIEDDGYRRRDLWTEEGWLWLAAQVSQNKNERIGPRYLQFQSGAWMYQNFGQLEPLRLHQVARHLSYFEAQAWCRWKNRRLPSEAEWEWAAHQPGFEFGEVWEWTSSPFLPLCSLANFQCHPYQDYSYPWFDGRPVLKGHSLATPERLRHRKFRNFFTPERNDIFVGFRSAKSMV
ncbi:MAG: selenoneine synthase SenA [Burkholderiaceae bacterium]